MRCSSFYLPFTALKWAYWLPVDPSALTIVYCFVVMYGVRLWVCPCLCFLLLSLFLLATDKSSLCHLPHVLCWRFTTVFPAIVRGWLTTCIYEKVSLWGWYFAVHRVELCEIEYTGTRVDVDNVDREFTLVMNEGYMSWSIYEFE